MKWCRLHWKQNNPQNIWLPKRFLKNIVVQEQQKIIIIIIRRRKAQKQHEDYAEFIKKVPLYPRERLKRKIKSQDKSAKKAKNEENDVELMKQVPSHPRDKLKKKTKKLPLIHPRDRFKRKMLQVAVENGKFNFAPKKILNKNLVFDTSRIDEGKMIDKIIESLPADNDERCWGKLAKHFGQKF